MREAEVVREVRCPFCEVSLSANGLSEHLATNHPPDDKRVRTAVNRFHRIVDPVVIAWGAAFLTFIAAMYLLQYPSIILLGGFLLTFLPVFAYAFLIAGRLDHPNRLCEICGEWISRIILEDHLRIVHPDEPRFRRIRRAVLTGLLALDLALLTTALRLFTPSGQPPGLAVGAALVLLGVVLYAFMAYVWGRFIGRPHVRRAILLWEASHPGKTGPLRRP